MQYHDDPVYQGPCNCLLGCWSHKKCKNQKNNSCSPSLWFPDQFELCSTVLPLSTGCTDVFTLRFQFYFNSILEPRGIHWILVSFCLTPLDSNGFCQNDQSLTGIGGTVKYLQMLLGVMFPCFGGTNQRCTVENGQLPFLCYNMCSPYPLA